MSEMRNYIDKFNKFKLNENDFGGGITLRKL